jgi:hypothetical protein
MPRTYLSEAGGLIAVGARITPTEHAKLRALAIATNRNYSDVIRLLLKLAEPTGVSDLRLADRPAGELAK